MSGPFPGMDPWLEHPATWQGVHNAFIVYAAETLQPLLRPQYVARLDARLYVSTVGRTVAPDVVVQAGHDEPRGGRSVSAVALEADPALVLEHVDDELNEAYIEIVDLQSDKDIVCVIELLSPTNKVSGEGHDLYVEKQQEVLRSSASLVEIDLLRSGPHVLAVPPSEAMSLGDYDYLVAVNRSWDRARRTLIYSRTVRQRLPRISVPLRSSEAGVTLDLQATFERVYEAGAFGDRVQYSESCIPPLRPDDEAWARERIRGWRAKRPA